MAFLGPVARLGGELVRPHDLARDRRAAHGSLEAMVVRVVHLGFEVRVELELGDGSPLDVQLTRDEADELELAARRHRVGPARRRRAVAGAAASAAATRERRLSA